MLKLRTISTFAASLLWFLIAVGAAICIFVIPALAQDLAGSYVEYQDDAANIQILLSAIAISAELILVFVAILLSKVKNHSLLESVSLRFARSLTASFLIFALALTSLLAWLSIKNTLPPLVMILLAVSILLGICVALITASLTQVLKDATKTRIELEAVI